MDEHILSIVLLFGPTAAELLSPQLSLSKRIMRNCEIDPSMLRLIIAGGSIKSVVSSDGSGSWFIFWEME